MSHAPSELLRRKQHLIHALFFLSGGSGLIYQVVWVRQFSYIFGNSVYSAAIVTALFMAGLGLGGWLAGAYIDSRFHEQKALPLKIYGWFEAAIGIAALLTAGVLPVLGSLSASVSSYVDLPNGWHTLSLGSNLLRFLVPVLLLTPVTALMGATLTLLIRFVVWNQVEQAGFHIGMLYGFNTLGAALGCLATDLFLVPTLGLFATQCLASFGNLIAGFGALQVAKLFESQETTSAEAARGLEADEASEAPTTSAKVPRLLLGACVAVLLSGGVGMGMEIVWFRYLISFLGAYREVFSLLLGTILIGMWLGSVLAGVLHRRFQRAAMLYAIAQAILITSAALPLILLTRTGYDTWTQRVWSGFEHAPLWLQTVAETTITQLVLITVVTALPAVVMGMTYPLANAIVQDQAGSVGRRAGLLYAANTLGAVLGALASGFWLLPQLGTQSSVLIWLFCSVLSLLPLLLTVRLERAERRVFAACGALAAAVLISWTRLPSTWLITQTVPPEALGEKILTASEGIGETIIIARNSERAQLITNGHNMSDTSLSGQRYMRLFSHLPLLNAPQATDALVICYGVGNTLNATLLHPHIQHVDLVDISAHVLKHAPYFRDVNGAPLEDPRVNVFINDGRQHLRMVQPGRYDLITAEPPPIAHAGVAALYSSEFYELAKSRLKAGGVMTHWLPIRQVPGRVGLSVVRAFFDVFPNAMLLNGSGHHLILVGVNSDAPFQLDPLRMLEALRANPAVQKDLAHVGADSLVDLAALLVATPTSLATITQSSLPVTDDYPIMEYDAYHPLRGREPLAPELFQPTVDFQSWCPHCMDPAIQREHLADLPYYLDILSQIYGSEAYLGQAGRIAIQTSGRSRELLSSSRYLRLILLKPNSAPH